MCIVLTAIFQVNLCWSVVLKVSGAAEYESHVRPYKTDLVLGPLYQAGVAQWQLKGSVKEPNISIYNFFFRPSLNGVLFPMFCLLVEGECQILVF